MPYDNRGQEQDKCFCPFSMQNRKKQSFCGKIIKTMRFPDRYAKIKKDRKGFGAA